MAVDLGLLRALWQAGDTALVCAGVAVAASMCREMARTPRPPRDSRRPRTSLSARGVVGAVGVLILAMVVPSAMALAAVSADEQQHVVDLRHPAGVRASAVEAAGRVLVVLLVIAARGRRPRSYAMSAPRAAGAAMAAFLVLLPLTGVVAVWTLHALSAVGVAPAQHPVLDALRGPLPATTIATLLFAAVVAAPLIEELVFRGVFYDALAPAGAVQAAWVSSVLFGLIHLFAPHSAPALICMGLVLCALREATGRVWPCMLAHAAFNARSMLGVLIDPTLAEL